MASGFFALFDNTAVIKDGLSVMTKVDRIKSAGIQAEDLAVNAEKASSFVSKRESPSYKKSPKDHF
jgi:predicted DNA repair protein MutK